MSEKGNIVSYGAKKETIPSDWDIANFGEISEVSQGLQIAKSERYKQPADDRVKYITIQYLNNPNDKQNIWYIEDPSESVVCNSDDILMTRTGNTGEVITDVEGAYHNNFFIIDYNDKANKKFIYEHLRKKKTQDLIMAYAGATTIPDLNHGDFYKIPVPVPPLSEQERIASILYSVDQHISTLDKRYTNLTNHKQALMQDLLTGNKRVTPDIDGKNEPRSSIESYEIKKESRGPFEFRIPQEWKIEQLGQVSEMITRGKQPSYDNQSNLPVLNQKCIYWDGFRFGNERHTPSEDWGKQKYHIEEGDLLINSTGKGTVGRCLVYSDDTDRVIDGHITRVVTNQDVESEFIRYFFESDLGSALLHSMGVNGSTGQVELSKEQLGFIPTPVPPLWEQERIASVLYTVDEMIARTDTLKQEYEQLKRGLMQDLLSGDVRTPDDIELLDEITQD